MQRDLVVVIPYSSIYNQYKIVKIYNFKYHKIISVGINFVFIYISLLVGIWWRVGNTKLLKHKKLKQLSSLTCRLLFIHLFNIYIYENHSGVFADRLKIYYLLSFIQIVIELRVMTTARSRFNFRLWI
jgi:hypothetical protein